ncbi:2-hydroxyacid dehydrogenase [Aequorivita capsosiphonis]|uniref:2-hydroxyacid dehydrogenase n=1 Tax=Aequorivita capsosiphonis TaxID=487317 RepID=UPI000408B0A2|nr:glyoxylate/hydroxypyruvate reductase A [Aequorivita capsosiphonis]
MPTTDKIVIICSQEKLIEPWRNALSESAPNITVEVYPDDTERENTEFLLAFRPPENAFEKYPKLKVIASMAAGIKHITKNHNLPENVILTKANDPMHRGDIAYFVLALTLSYMRRLPVYLQQKEQMLWQPHSYLRPEEITIGIMGIGSIGETVGKLMLKNDFKVTGWSRSEKHIDHIKTFHGNSQRADFLKTADILICTLPLTNETEGILNVEVFNKLPQGAYLINIGRGKELVEDDLLKAIETGQLAGAALDVFSEEPLPKNHSFWNNEKIMITPHTAGNIHPESAVKKIVHNYKAMKNGEELVDVVDIERGY